MGSMRDPVALRVSCVSDAIWLAFREGDRVQRDRLLGSGALLEDTVLSFYPGLGPQKGHGWDRGEKCELDRQWPCVVQLATIERTVAKQYVTHNPKMNRRSQLSCPRFAPVEVEGLWVADVFKVQLPPLLELPWPRMRASACTEEQHQRAARERVAYGVATRQFTTKEMAAAYLRKVATSHAKEPIRRIWTELVGALELPER